MVFSGSWQALGYRIRQRSNNNFGASLDRLHEPPTEQEQAQAAILQAVAKKWGRNEQGVSLRQRVSLSPQLCEVFTCLS